MYNRYIRQDDGSYSKVVEPEPHASGAPPRQPAPSPAAPDSVPPPQEPPPPPPFERPGGPDGTAGFLRRALDQLHLDRIDSGDLLLLGLLYMLFREKADEELLIALGLLLIL